MDIKKQLRMFKNSDAAWLNSCSFFEEFVRPVRPWFMELVDKCKEQGEFGLLPTYIAEYYADSRDKEIALISTFCVGWFSPSTERQLEDMRRIMGEHPWEWFRQRLFTAISTGNEQDRRIAGAGIEQWRVARFFDALHSRCTRRRCFRLENCLTGKGDSLFRKYFTDACASIDNKKLYMLKADVIELVLRTSDGIGLGLWKGIHDFDRCPHGVRLERFLKMWMTNWKTLWDFDSSIRCFGFRSDRDFFYFWLAWTRLSMLRPRECSRFSTVFSKRYTERHFAPPSYWKMYLPKINFNDER